MQVKKTVSPSKEIQSQTRTLLALWDLAGAAGEVKKSELTGRVKRTNEKAGDYQSIFERLAKEGAIALTQKNRSVHVSLTVQGLTLLGEGLKNPKFEYDAQVGAKTINALLKWMRQTQSVVSSPTTSSEATKKSAIASYKKFKQVALEVYDRLNRDYNLDDLVPIYRIRREIGDRVTRSQFDEWLLEMQANDILQMQGGSLPDNDPAKIEDSITTEVSGLRCYAKRLTS